MNWESLFEWKTYLAFLAGAVMSSTIMRIAKAVFGPGDPRGGWPRWGRCTRPPPGWTCSRPENHDGPCAAIRVRVNGVNPALPPEPEPPQEPHHNVSLAAPGVEVTYVKEPEPRSRYDRDDPV